MGIILWACLEPKVEMHGGNSYAPVFILYSASANPTRTSRYVFDFYKRTILDNQTGNEVANEKSHIRYNNDYTFTVFNPEGQETYTSEKFSFYNSENVNASPIFFVPMKSNGQNTKKMIKIMTHFPEAYHRTTLEVYATADKNQQAYLFNYENKTIQDVQTNRPVPFGQGYRVALKTPYIFEVYNDENKKVYESQPYSLLNERNENTSNVFPVPATSIEQVKAAISAFPNIGILEPSHVAAPIGVPPSVKAVPPPSFSTGSPFPPNLETIYQKADQQLQALEARRMQEISSPPNLEETIERMESYIM